jgi:predicted RNA-binding Zn-ribbon protein involved in translation (DUF1610 family)
MGTVNPYQPPSAPLDNGPNAAAAVCPKCGNGVATKVGFTWWGGALGPKLFHVVRCTQCRAQYNGKTGGKLTKTIILYQVAGVGLAVVIILLLRSLR